MDEQEYRWRFKILQMLALGAWKICPRCGERFWSCVEGDQICGRCTEQIEQLTVELLEQTSWR